MGGMIESLTVRDRTNPARSTIRPVFAPGDGDAPVRVA